MTERRHSIGCFFLGAMAALLVIGVAALGVYLHGEWRTGWVELVTVGAPLELQVLAAESDATIGTTIELASRAELALPDGEYRVRVNGKGRVGRTYRFVVNRGERQSHTISLDEGRLLGGETPPPPFMETAERPASIPFAPVATALELEPGGEGFVERSNGGLIYRDARSGRMLWDAQHSRIPFHNDKEPASWLPGLVPGILRAKLLEPAVDLNRDGIRDLVWYFGGAPALLALSGADGELIWNYVAKADGTGGPRRSGQDLEKLWYSGSPRWGEVAGMPIAADVDGDGTADLIATMVISESEEERNKRVAAGGEATGGNDELLCKRTVIAISGRTGARLWSYPIDTTAVARPTTGQIGLPMLVEGRRSKWIALLDGTAWRRLELATGHPHVGAIDLGFVPVRPVQHGDLDGDGEPEILALGAGGTGSALALHAISVKSGRELWIVGAGYDHFGPSYPAMSRELWDFSTAPRWPLVADLNGDGRSEIVVPDAGAMPPLAGYRGVRLIDCASRETRWTRPMRPESKGHDGVVHLVEAPDLDGDGTRDVIAVSRYDGRDPSGTAGLGRAEPQRIFVDAMSGKDGRAFWCWHVDLPAGQRPWIWPPAWFGRGKDGWPLVAVPLGGDFMDRSLDLPGRRYVASGVVHLLEASTGQEQHTVVGLERARFADLDGDGLGDLWGKADGELRAFRGEAGEAWRALGYFGPGGSGGSDMPVSIRGGERVSAGGPIDFDRDGVADVLLGQFRARCAGGDRKLYSGGAVRTKREGDLEDRCRSSRKLAGAG